MVELLRGLPTITISSRLTEFNAFPIPPSNGAFHAAPAAGNSMLGIFQGFHVLTMLPRVTSHHTATPSDTREGRMEAEAKKKKEWTPQPQTSPFPWAQLPSGIWPDKTI